MTEIGATAPVSHYTRIGGAGAVKAAVDLFYDRVLGDAELAGYFAGVDMVGAASASGADVDGGARWPERVHRP
ncbi:hypothetical protein Jiend_60670 [Micromonospora endophytica]|nr:hypothetical protein Jiend_60670 [Micromonospora endophytica]